MRTQSVLEYRTPRDRHWRRVYNLLLAFAAIGCALCIGELLTRYLALSLSGSIISIVTVVGVIVAHLRQGREPAQPGQWVEIDRKVES